MPCAENVDGPLRDRGEAEHAARAEEPGRGHWGDIRGTVRVFGGDEEDNGAEVEDGWGDGSVHGAECVRSGKRIVVGSWGVKLCGWRL